MGALSFSVDWYRCRSVVGLDRGGGGGRPLGIAVRGRQIVGSVGDSSHAGVDGSGILAVDHRDVAVRGGGHCLAVFEGRGLRGQDGGHRLLLGRGLLEGRSDRGPFCHIVFG